MTLSELITVLVGLDVEEGLGDHAVSCEQQDDGTFTLVIEEHRG